MSARVNAAGQPSQFLLNAQKELNKRRLLAGVNYRPPTPAEQSPTDWIAKLARPNSPNPPSPSLRATPWDRPGLASEKGRAQDTAPTTEHRCPRFPHPDRHMPRSHQPPQQRAVGRTLPTVQNFTGSGHKRPWLAGRTNCQRTANS